MNSGYVFESIITQAKKDIICRNEVCTNKWIPVVNCTEVTATPPPTPEIDLTKFDRIVMKRIGHAQPDGSIQYDDFTYTGEKDLDV